MNFYEVDSRLYRGFSREHLAVAWNEQVRRWQPIGPRSRLPGSREEVSQKEAERCFPGSSTAPQPREVPFQKELTPDECALHGIGQLSDCEFDFRPGVRRSPQEEEARWDDMPDHIINALNRRRAQLGIKPYVRGTTRTG